ncbi:MAG: hypothetical protein RLO52_38580 [Sandaracinaceae bacterium]
MLRALAPLLLASFLSATVASAQPTSATSAFWVHGPRGPRTYLRSPGGHGRWLRGVHVFIQGALIEVRVETVEVQAVCCQLGPCREPLPPLSLRRLVALRGDRREVLLDVVHEGAQWATDELLVHASLGPFLIVERRAYGHCGGAHGSGGRSIFWLDLRDASRVSVSAEGLPIDLAAAEAGLRERYRAALEASGSDPSEWMRLADAVGVQGVVPRFLNGAWRSDVHLQLGVPYAWTDGLTSYAIESTVQVLGLPGLASTHARVPDSVRAFLRRRRDISLGGVSGSR